MFAPPFVLFTAQTLYAKQFRDLSACMLCAPSTTNSNEKKQCRELLSRGDLVGAAGTTSSASSPEGFTAACSLRLMRPASR